MAEFYFLLWLGWGPTGGGEEDRHVNKLNTVYCYENDISRFVGVYINTMSVNHYSQYSQSKQKVLLWFDTSCGASICSVGAKESGILRAVFTEVKGKGL